MINPGRGSSHRERRKLSSGYPQAHPDFLWVLSVDQRRAFFNGWPLAQMNFFFIVGGSMEYRFSFVIP
jgi:hypothetical protein